MLLPLRQGVPPRTAVAAGVVARAPAHFLREDARREAWCTGGSGRADRSAHRGRLQDRVVVEKKQPIGPFVRCRCVGRAGRDLAAARPPAPWAGTTCRENPELGESPRYTR